jgi:xanthine dehydrogenase iron-sulfur cluster and FAD-binding subunit A
VARPCAVREPELALTGSLLKRENFSSFAAGWNWQVNPSWDMRAEANYRLADDSAEASELDRTQFYFSTRYGFR